MFKKFDNYFVGNLLNFERPRFKYDILESFSNNWCALHVINVHILGAIDVKFKSQEEFYI